MFLFSPSRWLGIIGAGRIGQVHLDTLASVPGVTPVIISDVVEPVLKMVTEKYGVPNYTMDVSRGCVGAVAADDGILPRLPFLHDSGMQDHQCTFSISRLASLICILSSTYLTEIPQPLLEYLVLNISPHVLH